MYVAQSDWPNLSGDIQLQATFKMCTKLEKLTYGNILSMSCKITFVFINLVISL